MLPGGVYQGMDTITDFGAGNQLDLSDFTNGVTDNIDDFVHVDWKEGELNSVLSVKIGDAIVDVALPQPITVTNKL